MNTQTNCMTINEKVSALVTPCVGVGGGAQGDKGMGAIARSSLDRQRAFVPPYEAIRKSSISDFMVGERSFLRASDSPKTKFLGFQ